MNRTELHSIQGFHAPSLLAAAAYLRLTMPRTRNAGDATAVIKNEGHMNGYLDAIADLTAAAMPEKLAPEKPVARPYSQPQTENQNRP